MIDTWMIGSVIGFSAGTAFGCWWKSLAVRSSSEEIGYWQACSESYVKRICQVTDEINYLRRRNDTLKAVNQALYDELSVLVGEKKRASMGVCPTGTVLSPSVEPVPVSPASPLQSHDAGER